MRSFGFILFTLVISLQATAQSPIDFDKHVAPLLAARCIECHNPTDRKGKLDLTTRRRPRQRRQGRRRTHRWQAVGKPLWDQVNSEEMPPKTALGADEKATIKAWITQGAKWGKTDPIDPYALTTAKRAGLDFWSLQPIKKTRPRPPSKTRAGHKTISIVSSSPNWNRQAWLPTRRPTRARSCAAFISI